MLVCPSCGRKNPDGFRFCGFCTAPLEPTAAEHRDERKFVSVLFVDLVGFTDRSDRADPEDVRATLRPYHARVKHEVERYGGVVEKFVGDGVLAVFGAPVAHEDDAERAVRAALRLLEAIDDLNEQHGLTLAVRAAVNTGEAVVSLGARPEAGESFVTGDVVNTASRLQQLAPVGGIVVGEVTQRATGDLIQYEPLEPATVKGKSEPISLWRAVGARGRYGVDAERRPAASFVGREDELALLRQLYTRAVRESSVQLVTVTGEPGVGKTRLVSELRAFVDDQPEIVYWRQGRCLPYGEGITFWALGEIIKSHTGILDSDSPEQAGEKLDAALRSVAVEAADSGWLRLSLSPLVGLTGTDEKQAAVPAELFTAWRRFLEEVALARPLVLIFEDLHWADETMLQFVEHLVDRAVDVPLLVVCSARPELYERAPGWGGGKRNATTIALAPLSGEETARLVSSLLSQAVLPAETQAALLERSGGNPLYAEEFVRMLLDRGLLERHGRALRAVEESEIPVPETLQALIAARLDTLSAERKSLVQDAAVIGKVFWSGALSEMGGAAEAAVEEGLHELARKELVRPSRNSSVTGQAEYAFWHLLVRDVAYGQMPRAERAAKHRAAALWIERIAEERVADHAELLVHHYGQALALSHAAGRSEASELEEPLRRFLLMAGDHAMALDIPTAAEHYRRAFELLPAGDPERPEALMKLAWAGSQGGTLALDEAERMLEEAIDEFRRDDRVSRAGEAMLRLAYQRSTHGDTAGSRAILNGALALLESEPPGPELVYAYAAKAGSHMLAGDPEECLTWADRALTLAEPMQLTEQIARALSFRGVARCELADHGGLDDLREGARIASQAGYAQIATSARNNLGEWIWIIEGAEPGAATKRDALAFAQRRGVLTLWSLAELCWPLYDLGDWDELVRVADEVATIEEERGKGQPGAIALPYKAQVLAHRGEVDAAAALAGDEFLDRARTIGDPQVLAPALAVASLLAQARGEVPAALSLVTEFEDLTRSRPLYRAHHMLEPLRVCIACGSIEQASLLMAGASGTAARHRYAILTGDAMLAEAHREHDRASTEYARVAERWEEYGFVLEQGNALLGCGRCLLALGQPGPARVPLAAARKVFAGLGAAPLVEQTDALLAEAA